MIAPSGNPQPPWAKRLLAFMLWALMAAIFGVCGWFFMLKPVVVATGNWWLARDYASTQGDVVPHTGSDDSGSFTWYGVRYLRDGKTYETSRLSVLEDEAIDERFNATVFKRLERAKAAAKSVDVWVSPRVPEAAILSRDLPVQRLWSKGLAGAVFAVLALAGLAGAVGSLAGFSYHRRLLDVAPTWAFASAWCGFAFPVLILVSESTDDEWMPLAFIGFFALIGLLLVWSAISASLGYGSSGGVRLRVGEGLTAASLATSRGKRKPGAAQGDSQAAVKRGGIGGQGDKR